MAILFKRTLPFQSHKESLNCMAISTKRTLPFQGHKWSFNFWERYGDIINSLSLFTLRRRHQVNPPKSMKYQQHQHLSFVVVVTQLLARFFLNFGGGFYSYIIWTSVAVNTSEAREVIKVILNNGKMPTINGDFCNQQDFSLIDAPQRMLMIALIQTTCKVVI